MAAAISTRTVSDERWGRTFTLPLVIAFGKAKDSAVHLSGGVILQADHNNRLPTIGSSLTSAGASSPICQQLLEQTRYCCKATDNSSRAGWQSSEAALHIDRCIAAAAAAPQFRKFERVKISLSASNHGGLEY